MKTALDKLAEWSLQGFSFFLLLPSALLFSPSSWGNAPKPELPGPMATLPF